MAVLYEDGVFRQTVPIRELPYDSLFIGRIESSSNWLSSDTPHINPDTSFSWNLVYLKKQHKNNPNIATLVIPSRGTIQSFADVHIREMWFPDTPHFDKTFDEMEIEMMPLQSNAVKSWYKRAKLHSYDCNPSSIFTSSNKKEFTWHFDGKIPTEEQMQEIINKTPEYFI